MRKIVSNVASKWHQYKYRFVPWQIFNWQDSRATVKRIERSEDIKDDLEAIVCDNLKDLFDKFNEVEKSSGSIDDALFESWGFNIKKKKSLIKGAGDGVFVSKGMIPRNAVAAIYPGTIYQPSDPLFIQSVSNPFILRCVDGIMIDGNHKGISKFIHRSCCGRDVIGLHAPCDISWLTETLKNPLAIGQFVNNQTHDFPANVVYKEVDIPISFPLNLRRYLPNIYYQNKFTEDFFDQQESQILMRSVVLISLSEINADDEILSAYFTEVF